VSAAAGFAPSPIRVAAGAALTAAVLALAGMTETARAADCKSTKVAKFKVKKIRKSDGIACGDARRVGKLWVKRDYDDFNPIHIGDNRWFCSWRRRAPQSTTTGTAECDADPGEEVNFAVRKRR
jgi:hypothetical protein